jgi:O-antigen/teichoic acid export membrane protein
MTSGAASHAPTIAPRQLTLRENFAWSLAGNLVYALCQWAMLSVISKLGTTTMIGEFAMATALTTPIFILAQMQLRTVQASDTTRLYSFADFFTLRIIAALIASLVVLTFVFCSDFAYPYRYIVVSVTAFKVVELFTDIYYGRLQQSEEMDRIGASLAARGVISLLAMGTVLSLGGTLPMALLSIAVSWVVVLIFWDRRLPRSCTQAGTLRDASLQRVWQLFYTCMPLGGAAVFNSLSVTIPRYILGIHCGPGELGGFAATASFMLASNMVVGALAQSATPRLAHYFAHGERGQFVKLLIQLCAFLIALGSLACLTVGIFGAQLLALAFRPELSVYAPELCWLTFAATIFSLSAILNCSLSAARSLAVQLPITLILCITTTLLGHYLIPNHGVQGAAWTSVAAATTQFVLTAAALCWAFRTRTSPLEQIEYPLLRVQSN